MTQQHSGEAFALDNLTYDLITLVHEKSKALEAYGKYEHDAQGYPSIQQLLQQLRQQDEYAVQQLIRQLAYLMDSPASAPPRALDNTTDTARLAST